MSQHLFGPNGFIDSEENKVGRVTIYWAGKEFYCFNRNDELGKKIGIALLASIHVYQKTICDLFKVGRNTVTRIDKIYTEKGIEGLKSYKQGPKEVGEAIKEFIYQMYLNLKDERGYQKKILDAVEKKYNEGIFSLKVSRGKMHIIINEYQSKEKKVIDEGHDISLKESNNKSADKKIVDIKKENIVTNGGSILSLIISNQFDFQKHIPSDGISDKKFTNMELVSSYIMLNSNGSVQVEQNIKHIDIHEMGSIIGRNSLPSLSLFRSRIPNIVENMDMAKVIEETSKKAHQLIGFSKTIYIDGHFMPYYGKANTLTGWFPQKRLPMKGREYFFVHDESGNPVYSAISDGYQKMKFYINKIDAKLRKIYGVKKMELLEVFDRGGYSKEFCFKICKTIRFICWKSDSHKVPDNPKWKEVRIIREGNNVKEKKELILKVWSRKITFEINNKKNIFREIWIKKGEKISPAITNDFTLSTGSLVRKLLKRWGAQENQFKELKEHGIDKIHSYQKETYTEDMLYEKKLEDPMKGIEKKIPNPVYTEITKNISILKKQIEKLKIMKDGKKNKISDTNKEYNELLKKRKSIPKKIILLKRINEKNILKICDEKKLFFDWLKIISIWSKHQLIEMIKPIYKDLRDIKKFVESLLNKKIKIVKNGNTLNVFFKKPKSKIEKEIFNYLLPELNMLNPLWKGMRFKKINFDVC